MDKIARTTQDIGRRLRVARIGAGLTLAAVARQASVSEGFLSKLERGQAQMLMTVARPADAGDLPDWWRLATTTTTKKEETRS